MKTLIVCIYPVKKGRLSNGVNRYEGEPDGIIGTVEEGGIDRKRRFTGFSELIKILDIKIRKKTKKNKNQF